MNYSLAETEMTKRPAPATLRATKALLSGLGGAFTGTLVFNHRHTLRDCTYDISGDLGIVQTLAAFALQGDVMVAEESLNEIVHSRLLERAPLPLSADELGGTFDILPEEVRDICMWTVNRKGSHGPRKMQSRRAYQDCRPLHK